MKNFPPSKWIPCRPFLHAFHDANIFIKHIPPNAGIFPEHALLFRGHLYFHRHKTAPRAPPFAQVPLAIISSQKRDPYEPLRERLERMRYILTGHPRLHQDLQNPEIAYLDHQLIADNSGCPARHIRLTRSDNETSIGEISLSSGWTQGR